MHEAPDLHILSPNHHHPLLKLQNQQTQTDALPHVFTRTHLQKNKHSHAGERAPTHTVAHGHTSTHTHNPTLVVMQSSAHRWRSR